MGMPVEYTRWSATGWSARRAETRSTTRTSAMDHGLGRQAFFSSLYLNPTLVIHGEGLLSTSILRVFRPVINFAAGIYPTAISMMFASPPRWPHHRFHDLGAPPPVHIYRAFTYAQDRRPPSVFVFDSVRFGKVVVVISVVPFPTGSTLNPHPATPTHTLSLRNQNSTRIIKFNHGAHAR